MSRVMVEKDVTLDNGLRTHYYEWPGEGPPLIFLHPSAGYGRIWEWTADALGDRFHVYAADQRGHGRTDKADGDYSAQEYAEDVRLFMNSVGIDKAIIVGHSLGGRVAQIFAAEYPAMTLAMGLVAGPHLSNFVCTRKAALSAIENAYRMTNDPCEFASEDEALAFMKATHPWTHDPDEGLKHRIKFSFTRRADGTLAMDCDPVRVGQGLMHMADNLRPYAARVRCPVHIFRASRSEALTRQRAEDLAQSWPDARVVDVEGHYALQLENPLGLAGAIRAMERPHA